MTWFNLIFHQLLVILKAGALLLYFHGTALEFARRSAVAEIAGRSKVAAQMSYLFLALVLSLTGIAAIEVFQLDAGIKISPRANHLFSLALLALAVFLFAFYSLALREFRNAIARDLRYSNNLRFRVWVDGDAQYKVLLMLSVKHRMLRYLPIVALSWTLVPVIALVFATFAESYSDGRSFLDLVYENYATWYTAFFLSLMIYLGIGVIAGNLSTVGRIAFECVPGSSDREVLRLSIGRYRTQGHFRATSIARKVEKSVPRAARTLPDCRAAEVDAAYRKLSYCIRCHCFDGNAQDQEALESLYWASATLVVNSNLPRTAKLINRMLAEQPDPPSPPRSILSRYLDSFNSFLQDYQAALKLLSLLLLGAPVLAMSVFTLGVPAGVDFLKQVVLSK